MLSPYKTLKGKIYFFIFFMSFGSYAQTSVKTNETTNSLTNFKKGKQKKAIISPKTNTTKFKEFSYFLKTASTTDTDSDGIIDIEDIDDDNDGVIDIRENQATTPVNLTLVTTPEAYWPLNNTTDDAFGIHNATASSSPSVSFSTDAIEGSYSASFNGNNYVVYSVDEGFMESETTTISFSAWIKPANLSGYKIIFDEGGLIMDSRFG